MSIVGGFTITTPRPGILRLARLAGDSTQGQLFDDLAALPRAGAAEDGRPTRWWPDALEVFHAGSGGIKRLSTSYRREVVFPALAEMGRALEPPRKAPGIAAAAAAPGHNMHGAGDEDPEDEEMDDGGQVQEEQDGAFDGLQGPAGPPQQQQPSVTVQMGPQEVVTRVAGTLQPSWGGGDAICALEFTVDRRAPANARMPGRDVHVPPRPARPLPRPPAQPAGAFSFRAPPGFGVCALWGRGMAGRLDALGVYYACCLPAWTPRTHRLYPNSFKVAARLVCYGARQHLRDHQVHVPQPLVHMILEALAQTCYFEFEGAEAAGWGGDVLRAAVQRATVERARRAA